MISTATKLVRIIVNHLSAAHNEPSRGFSGRAGKLGCSFVIFTEPAKAAQNEITGEDGTLAPDTGFAGVLNRELPDASDAAGQVVRLFDELRPGLFRYLRWHGSTAEEADDAIQETFLRLYAHLRTGGRDTSLRAWVFCVAGNLIRDDRKSGRRRLSRPLDAEIDAAACTDPGAGPEELVLARESRQRLHAAIGRLPVTERECLALRGEGLRYREIGEILGIGTSTVADVLKRAFETLAKELS
jgi:RNA polymerase sigma-70 factor (ECF subfamily)